MFTSLLSKVFASSSNVSANAHATPDPKVYVSPMVQIPVAINPSFIKRIAQVKAEARAYEHGLGVPEDIEKAISLYIVGAELGGAYAIFKLAGFYANGIHLPLDRDKAAMWYKIGMELHPRDTIFSSRYLDLMSNTRI